ncbi:MAG: hypothetical protein ACKVT0_03815 [Planctomycetaceae bacterium]
MQNVRVLRTGKIAAKVLTLAVSAFLIITRPAAAEDDLLVVRLFDGQAVQGVLDEQTNDERLWISSSAPDIVLSSSYLWSEIDAIEVGQKELSKSEILKLASGRRTRTNPDSQIQERIAFWFPVERTRADVASAIEYGSDATPQVSPSSQVEFLEIDARAMNWDRDAELDGLLVHVRPMDGEGHIVPVNAQIRFQLFGERHATNIRRTFDAEIPFPQIIDWTERIRAVDFGPDGVVVKLSFRRLHPEFNTDLAAHALLTARLGIAGKGTFDASAADVYLRPSSRYRDDLFQRTPGHQRYLPDETTRHH